MPTTIKVKNRTDWVLAFITSVALLVTFFITVFIIPLISAEETYFLSAISYISKIVPSAGLFILLLYLWLWNIFGKTILNIKDDSITITYKNKLFTKPKTFYKQDVKEIETIDLKIEKYTLGVRYHFSWRETTYSVVLMLNNEDKRIIDWVTKDEADEITDKIKEMWYKSKSF